MEVCAYDSHNAKWACYIDDSWPTAEWTEEYAYGLLLAHATLRLKTMADMPCKKQLCELNWSINVFLKIWNKGLFKNFCSNRALSTFFSERVVNVWNYLPHDIVNFSSLCVFKRSIQLVDSSEFLKCY